MEAPSLPQRDDGKTRKDTKSRTNKNTYNGSNDKQWMHNKRDIALEHTVAEKLMSLLQQMVMKININKDD